MPDVVQLKSQLVGTLFGWKHAQSPSSDLDSDILAFMDSLYLGFFLFFAFLFSSLECPWYTPCVLEPWPSFYINEFLFLLIKKYIYKNIKKNKQTNRYMLDVTSELF